MTLKPYEPDQIARLYSLSRDAGWEIFFLTNRPASAGDSVQFQTQSWIERYGFYMPSVLTIPGLARRGCKWPAAAPRHRRPAPQLHRGRQCVDRQSASALSASGDTAIESHALQRGIGVVPTLKDAIEIVQRLHALIPARKGRLMRLADWFSPPGPAEPLPVQSSTDPPASTHRRS